MNDTFKYFAFISYNVKDTIWGKRLQKKLEHYRMPATLCAEHGWPRNPIKPVFFAPTDIQPGGLSEELQERLKASQNLIVICSPNSAKSEWVGKEIEYFHSLGRAKNIHFFIVEGTPRSGHPETECFNPVIDKLGLPEILGANIHEQIYRWPWLNKERAYVQLISKLLGVEFDSIWQRHKRLLIRRILTWMIGIGMVVGLLVGIWSANQPFDAEIHLIETSIRNAQLPPLKDAVITLALDNEIKTDTIKSLENKCIFANIPHRFHNRVVRFTVNCRDFLSTDTSLCLTSYVALDIKRDETVYGTVDFRIWDRQKESFLSGVHVNLAGQETVSDSEGRVKLLIPMESQSRFYCVTSSVPLENDTVYMPCGKEDVLIVE